MQVTIAGSGGWGRCRDMASHRIWAFCTWRAAPSSASRRRRAAVRATRTPSAPLASGQKGCTWASRVTSCPCSCWVRPSAEAAAVRAASSACRASSRRCRYSSVCRCSCVFRVCAVWAAAAARRLCSRICHRCRCRVISRPDRQYRNSGENSRSSRLSELIESKIVR